MKYKVLLSGSNKTTINEFFMKMSDDIQVMTTSERYDDIMNHLEFLKPDMFVSCLSNETDEYVKRLVLIKSKLKECNTSFAIIGSEEKCNEFLRNAFGIIDLVLTKPITAGSIENRIKAYLKEQEHLKEVVAQVERERLKEQEAQRKRMEQDDEKKHILVVDDDPLMLKVIKQHLRDQYSVATATSGKIALKFLEKKTTDLILLDYQMPMESGPEVLEKLHANDATKDIPVVFLTGITDRSKIQQALVLRPQGYLLKPVDHNKLMQTIKDLIG